MKSKLVLVMSLGMLLGSTNLTLGDQLEPDIEQSSPGPVLSPEEKERLLQRTQRVVDPGVPAGCQPAPSGLPLERGHETTVTTPLAGGLEQPPTESTPPHTDTR